MVNTQELLIQRNKELLNKIEELEKGKNVEISREAQLKIIDKIEKWKKENHETGERLKKYQGNTYPAHITNNTTTEWPLWRQLAGHVNFELMMAEHLDKKEEPLNELLKIMLNSITRNVVGYYCSEGNKEKERKEWKQKEDKYKEKIERLLNETFPFDKLKEKLSQLSRWGVSRCYLDTVNGIDYSNYIIDAYKEREEEFKKEVQELEIKVKELEENNKWLQKELKEAWSEGDTHIEAMQYAGELAKGERDNLTKQIGVLENAGKEILEALVKTEEQSKERLEANENLRQELRGQKELLANSQTETREKIKNNEELKEQNQTFFQLYLDNKPLPKTPSKFKIFKGKIKNKFQQLTKKKSFHHEQKLVAKIEVPVK